MVNCHTRLKLTPRVPITLGEIHPVACEHATDADTASLFMNTLPDAAPGRLLIADDESANLEILSDLLDLEGYETECVRDGRQALERLREAPAEFDALLLDRMMPMMDGIEVTRQLRGMSQLRHLPIIMQTAATSRSDILSGLEAGASYYLTKPIDMSLLAQIVRTAVAESRTHRSLITELKSRGHTVRLLQFATFHFRTLDEAAVLAALLARAAAQPDRVAMGLSELMINAVEHGNLGIGYEEKSDLNRRGLWHEEIQRRLGLAEHAGKRVTVHFRRETDCFKVTIRDQGQGFDWNRYLEIDPTRAFDTHGRGIAMARKLSFTAIEYRDGGCEVEATIRLAPDAGAHDGAEPAMP